MLGVDGILELSGLRGFPLRTFDGKVILGPASPSTIHRDDVGVSHFLKIVCGQCRSESATAIKYELYRWVGKCCFDIPFDNALAYVFRARQVSGRELTFFSNIDEVHRFTTIESFLYVVNRALANAGSRIVDNIEKLGGVVFGHSAANPG